MALGKNLKKTEKRKTTKNVLQESGQVQKAEVEVISEVEPEKTEKENIQESDVQLAEVNQQIEGVEEVSEKLMIVVFPVGTEEYALPIDSVKEVVKTPPIAPVPQVENHVMGVANIRGNVYAIINLAEKVGLENANDDEGKFSLVIQDEEYKVAIAVKKVPDTIVIEKDEMDQSLAMAQTSLDESFIRGVVKRDDRMIIVIDILEMIAQEGESVLVQ